MSDAAGYAVKWCSGEIDVATVSPTERAAQVNGLVLSGVHVMPFYSDELISKAWGRIASETGASIVKVTISERADA